MRIISLKYKSTFVFQTERKKIIKIIFILLILIVLVIALLIITKLISLNTEPNQSK